MAINIHTDKEFEKRLNWLTRKIGKSKTQIIKELVFERYQSKKEGFQFGSLKRDFFPTSQQIQQTLKEMDKDHDLD
jgi:predicted DNA-binding protein